MKRLFSIFTSFALALGTLIAVAPSAFAANTISPTFAITNVADTFEIEISDLTYTPIDDTTCTVTSESVEFDSVAATGVVVTANFVAGTASIEGDIPVRAIGDEENNINVVVEFNTDCDAGTQTETHTLTGAFDYVDAPTIDDVSPAFGEAGSTVIIEGLDLLDVDSVKFGDSATPAELVTAAVVSKTDTLITVTVPSGKYGLVDIVVAAYGTTVASNNSFTYTPTISSVSKGTGKVAGGDTVIINGTGLSDADTVVKFGSATATNGSVNATGTALTVTTPAVAAGPVNVSVEDSVSGSNTLTNAFRFIGAPTITAATPLTGSTGTTVTITGTNLYGDSDELLVKFGTTYSTTVLLNNVNGTSITATVPAKAAADPWSVDVIVETRGGSVTHTSDFEYSPTLTTVSPNRGPIGGGNVVTLTGTNLDDAASVQFGATNGTILTNTNTTIQVQVPAGTGTVDVKVNVPGGKVATKTAGYTYDVFAISSLSQGTGSVDGDQVVRITGAGFTANTKVFINSTQIALADVAFVSATALDITTPAFAAGPVDITVTDGAFTDTLAQSFRFVEEPTINEFNPKTGPVSGGTQVTVSGTSFFGDADELIVKFGTATAVVDSQNSTGTSLTVEVPAKATADALSVKLIITNKAGTVESTVNFVYSAAPTVTSITPAYGPLSGSTLVTIQGTNLQAVSKVEFGSGLGTEITPNAAGTQLTVKTPARATSGAVDVTITGPGGVTTITQAFEYVNLPTATSINVAYGPLAGGNVVKVLGTNMAAGTATVTFGTTAATILSKGQSEIQVLAPAGTGTVNVVVVIRGVTFTLQNAYTYLAAPSITSITPALGLLAGGTVVTLQGSNLQGVSKIEFGGVAGTEVTPNAAGTQVTVKTPPKATAGAVSISITGPGGVTILSNAFSYVAKICTAAEIGKLRFAVNTYKLTDAMKAKLGQLATSIKQSGCDVVVMRHFKSVQTSTVGKALVDLTNKRVLRVKNYLTNALVALQTVVTIKQVKLPTQKLTFTSVDQFKVNRVIQLAVSDK